MHRLGGKYTEYYSRLNPDAIERMRQMSSNARKHLRKVGRDRDGNHSDAKFRLEQAEVDLKEAKEKREAADRAKKKATERQVDLKAFKPILDLKRLQELGLKGCNAKDIQKQIRWHRNIGKDAHIPPHVSKMKKPDAWPVMIRAVRRHLRGMAADEGMSFATRNELCSTEWILS